MKNILVKTTLTCAFSIMGISAFAVDGNTFVNQGGYDAGLIDNTNFIQAKQYQAKTKYEEIGAYRNR